ncbi:hypothetical protein L7F22_021541 [Adiantum nelumboides]|nr:hypothetical protein [Adiantum nelumboides]
MADLEVIAEGSLLDGASDPIDAVDGAAAVGKEGVKGGSGIGAGGAAYLPADAEAMPKMHMVVQPLEESSWQQEVP